MLKIIKRKNKSLVTYPSIDHLNIALRDLLENPQSNRSAIEEICYAITKSGGYFYDDVAADIRANKIFKI